MKFSRQFNYCVSFLGKSKWEYFKNLQEKNINNNKTFWKNIKSFLSNKVTSANKMTLIDKGEIITLILWDIGTVSFLVTILVILF